MDAAAMKKMLKEMYKKMDEMYNKLSETSDPEDAKKLRTDMDKMKKEMEEMMPNEHRSSFSAVERRTNSVELRVRSDEGKQPCIEGYAAKFRTLSEPMPIKSDGEIVGMFREQLMPGCFASAIPVSDTRCLFNHDPNLILGRTKSGTMRIAEDEVGLRFEVDPPDTTYSRNLQVSMSRGDITQCSFGFQVADGGDTYTKDESNPGWWIRSIHKIAKLFDASPVTYPAYVDTNCDIAVRSILSEIEKEQTEEEKRVAAQIEEEKRIEAEKAEAERLAEEQRVAAELAEQEEANRVAEEQRQIELDNELRMRELDLLERLF